MPSKLDVINSALRRLAANGANLSYQDTPAAQIAEAAYSQALNYCLGLYPWAFATRYMRLGRSATAPAFGYKYAYSLPGDCVRVIDVRCHGEDGSVPAMAWNMRGQPWAIVGRSVYTDAGSVALRYVSNKLDTQLSDLFADALAWRLAFEISAYLPQGGANSQNFLQLFEQSLDRAKSEGDAQEEPVTVGWTSKFLQERWVN